VEFVDAATGETFAFTESPPEALPETFALNTTLHLGDQDWSVERAEPMTRAEYIQTGNLVLTLAKVMQMPVKDILFSLPTLYDPLPRGDGQADTTGKKLFTLHADLWRHMEFVSVSQQEIVDHELDAIVSIYEQHREAAGFNKLHIRQSPTKPIDDELTLSDLQTLFAGAVPSDGIVFPREPGIAQDVFALQYGSYVLYGDVEGTHIQSLAVHPQSTGEPLSNTPFVQLMNTYQLILVDWLRVRVLPPQNAQTRLQEFLEAT
jgi:hypothetical protein